MFSWPSQDTFRIFWLSNGQLSGFTRQYKSYTTRGIQLLYYGTHLSTQSNRLTATVLLCTERKCPFNFVYFNQFKLYWHEEHISDNNFGNYICIIIIKKPCLRVYLIVCFARECARPLIDRLKKNNFLLVKIGSMGLEIMTFKS